MAKRRLTEIKTANFLNQSDFDFSDHDEDSNLEIDDIELTDSDDDSHYIQLSDEENLQTETSKTKKKQPKKP